MNLLDVENLSVSFGRGHRPVVRGVSLSVAPGECVALVGESGSGKSVTARALLGLAGRGARVGADRLEIDGVDATGFSERRWRSVRGRRIGMVLQDAMVSLDPLRTIGAEIAEGVTLHRDHAPRDVRRRVVELLVEAGVPEPETRRTEYPHQLSGGLRQRALIASALAADPRLLIADEPTTALDAVVQAQILRLLERVKNEGRGLLLISHDLAVVAQLADRVLVLNDGDVVESGPTAQLLEAPAHPYTRTLLDSVPTGRRRGGARVPGDTLLTAERLVKTYGPSRRGATPRRALDDVSLTLRAGESLGVVGESGSGKSTLARVLLGLAAPDSGQVRLGGEPWTTLDERARRPLRHRVQLIHQDPYAAFDPRFTVARIIGEALPRTTRRQRTERAARLLEQVGLGADHLRRRPHELSGGQRQRVAVARALAPRPQVLVCDEPVSALDVTVQAQVLDLLVRLREDTGVALVFITHDLAVVQEISDRVLVMRDGTIVDEGPTREVFRSPRHEYTRSLVDAIPALARASTRDLSQAPVPSRDTRQRRSVHD
ncbi:dipeptide ABC transporter ATP-binding protein [Streptomyces hokutonensis]|uniref:dipeptide ABC transporter ATP-binding protein n=1 Tax=Streptomyces hokutonensis TaxID=1306990 RepID=UPI00037F429E|nr:ABC transporter ATP-binding protein [Streptomyces hokutonensis]